MKELAKWQTWIFGHFSQIWVNFGQKGPFFKIIPKNVKHNFFWTPETILRTKNEEILMCGYRKKMRKPAFLVILAKFRPKLTQQKFGSILAKKGHF